MKKYPLYSEECSFKLNFFFFLIKHNFFTGGKSLENKRVFEVFFKNSSKLQSPTLRCLLDHDNGFAQNLLQLVENMKGFLKTAECVTKSTWDAYVNVETCS